MSDDKLHDEEGRLAALHRYQVLDTPREAPFERITALVQTVLQVPISTVSLIDANRQWYKACAGMESTESPREESFCTHTIQSRDPFLIPDTWEDPRFAEYLSVKSDPFIRSYLGVPLVSPDGYNLGALCALDRKPRNFQPAQIEVMKSFAALVVEELELRRIAQIDSLTEAATRRAFLLELDKAIARFNRHQVESSLIVMDLDHFKRINDTYGHPAGDSVLREVSARLRSLLRKEDLLGRLGGEEFGILLMHSSAVRAAETADRFRQAVADLVFTGDHTFRVTASFGVAAFTESESRQDWMAKADAALYNAKRAGRNRVSCSALQIEPALAEA